MNEFYELDINEIKHSKTLYRSICLPSLANSYSLCIGFMKHWFLTKFKEGTFKSINVEGNNVFSDYKRLDTKDLIKREKPSLLVSPSIDWTFDNEKVDMYPYGLSLYTQMGKFKDSFFQDDKNNIYLGIGLETLFMPFNFRIKVETRAMQMDFFKYIKMACRVGSTMGEYIDLDFHVPYDLMIQIAIDAGFTVEEKNGVRYVINVIEFLSYLNSHSTLPFLYKFRTINGRNEFFIRMSGMYVHIRPLSLSVDDGEKEGQLFNNFTIELPCEVRFPSPKMYAYYSLNNHELEKLYQSGNSTGDLNIATIYSFKTSDVPNENVNGWKLFLKTSYEDEEAIGNTLTIDFNELFEGTLLTVIKETIKVNTSPSIFLDISLINNGHNLKYTIDWSTLILTVSEPVDSIDTFIGIYCDMAYMNDKLNLLNGAQDNRISFES